MTIAKIRMAVNGLIFLQQIHFIKPLERIIWWLQTYKMGQFVIQMIWINSRIRNTTVFERLVYAMAGWRLDMIRYVMRGCPTSKMRQMASPTRRIRLNRMTWFCNFGFGYQSGWPTDWRRRLDDRQMDVLSSVVVTTGYGVSSAILLVQALINEIPDYMLAPRCSMFVQIDYHARHGFRSLPILERILKEGHGR